MHVIHAIWSDNRLYWWVEAGAALASAASLTTITGATAQSRDSGEGASDASTKPTSGAPLNRDARHQGSNHDLHHHQLHPFAAGHDEIRRQLGRLAVRPELLDAVPATLTLRLPAQGGRPLPSPRLARQLGLSRAGYLANGLSNKNTGAANGGNDSINRNASANGEDASGEDRAESIATGSTAGDAASTTAASSATDSATANPAAARASSSAPASTAPPSRPRIETITVPAIASSPGQALAALAAIDAGHEIARSAPPDDESSEIWLGDTVRYWIVVGRLIAELIAAQRFVPILTHELGGEIHGGWRLWLHDEESRRRLALLVRSMPPVLRAAVSAHDDGDDFICEAASASAGGESAGAADRANGANSSAAAAAASPGPVSQSREESDPWRLLDSFITSVTDATIRRHLSEEDLLAAIRGWRHGPDLHTAWLGGLLGEADSIDIKGAEDVKLLRGVRQWINRLSETGHGRPFQLCLRLEEPPGSDSLADMEPPDDRVRWPLVFCLQSAENPRVVVEAERVWEAGGEVMVVDGLRVDHPQDILLSELARAGKLFPPIEKALKSSRPAGIELLTDEAYAFLRDVRPLLEESGFNVIAPKWWGRSDTRLAARLQITSDEIDEDDPYAFAFSPTGRPTLGLDSVVDFSWQIALGDQTLTIEQFRRLVSQRSPLVRVQGRWIEVRPEDVRDALKFLDRGESGEIAVRDALRLAYGTSKEQPGLPVVGMDATGWVGKLFGATRADDGRDGGETPLKPVPQPQSFVGQLRPYQVKGLSWLAFLDQFGLGSCLADDMGLGKTIQLIALLQWERERLPEHVKVNLGPTLLVVPTSVVGNWVREIRRFAPAITVMVHHGMERHRDAALVEAANKSDVVITTYALAYRDRESLAKIEWWRVVLDEAQNIKNPSTKQTSAIRALKAGRRVALTGTPVENRLTELWSIFEFLNPGYLGTPNEFRRTFAAPIERYRDVDRAGKLRGLVQPFVLRRLKTDPNVIADLPEKLEHKVYCNLTAEQARLYESIVQEMLAQADAADGIQRRGLVLAALTKLKQACNHPDHFGRAREGDEGPIIDAVAAGSARSGKTARLIEMLDEALSEGDCALVFTQFRQMGHLLSAMIRHDLDVEPLFLHGGVPAAKREELIETFQKRDGSAPIFILSLKAGGTGLNLTAANHVFHFDRWWNPAIENQATDRAFRIGQTRAVQVHKFVCSGTLEERIDQMIEEKTELAENVIGSGEAWLTELSTAQLRDILALRYEDVGEE